MSHARIYLNTAKATVVITAMFISSNLFQHINDHFGAAGQFVWKSASFIAFFTMLYYFKTRARRMEERCTAWLDANNFSLQGWIDNASPRGIRISIAVVAALTLFLELVLIRWQGSLFPVFALYKNFTMLACFCGIGIGYAMSGKRPFLLPTSLPMLALTLFSLVLLRYATDESLTSLFSVVPVHEELSVHGSHVQFHLVAGTGFYHFLQIIFTYLVYYTPVYLLLIGTFALNALLLLPAGQLCGALMERETTLVSYGFNLLGSIAGIVLLFILSWLWIGPVIWFGLCCTVIAWYLLPVKESRTISLYSILAVMIITAWPVEPLIQNIYSPYQFIQKTSKSDGYMQILAGGVYYQKVYNLSKDNPLVESDEHLKKIAAYYNLPFRTAPSLDNVAIVGAGSGNDVAAALRGGAKHVDAVEIDPAIRNLGIENHPEAPYRNERVNSIVNDARTFFRNTTSQFDTVVYGVLDSHILLSHGSNVRVDSFVYTVEGLRDAFAHVKPGGMLSVSFALPTTSRMGEKIYQILRMLPGAGEPKAILTEYDAPNTTTFMVRKGEPVVLPQSFLEANALKDVTENYAKLLDSKVDLPTDDWPFFYMNFKTFPSEYVISLLMILTFSTFLVRVFLPGQKLDVSLMPFFFLGCGFMLVETKAITELGLLFGNTWYVVGITIISVLIMAFLANITAMKKTRLPMPLFYGLLLAAIALGYAVALHTVAMPSTGAAAMLMLVVLLTCPLFFSGIIFSSLLSRCGNLGGAMAYNLMGAMLGGVLEYNSMQFGFAALYVFAFAFYAMAWVSSRRKVIA